LSATSTPETAPTGPTRVTFVQIACFAAMVASCLIVGWSESLFRPLWNDLMSFLTGAHSDIARRDAPLSTVIADSMAVAILTVPFIAVGILLAGLTGGLKSKRVPMNLFHACGEKKAPGPWPALFMAIHKIGCIVLIEEFYARWLFLGLLTQISWLSGPSAFYLLFLAGNVLWTLIHIANWVKGQRRISVVFPVFCYGIVAVVMFLRHGLLGAFIAHLFWDLVLMVPIWLGQTLKKRPLTL